MKNLALAVSGLRSFVKFIEMRHPSTSN